jgi:hypothetical protein
MRTTTRLFTLLVCGLLSLLLVACGAKPATIADLPVYPGAVELKPGESAIGDTLQQNMEQDAAMREAAGAGGSTEQKGFSLTGDASWAAIKSFYGDELKAKGWQEGVGGPGGSIASQMLETANEGNELFQTAMFSKDKQVLSVIRVASPTDPNVVELLLSLSTR